MNLTDAEWKTLVSFMEEFFGADFSGLDMPSHKYLKQLWRDWESEEI